MNRLIVIVVVSIAFLFLVEGCDTEGEKVRTSENLHPEFAVDYNAPVDSDNPTYSDNTGDYTLLRFAEDVPYAAYENGTELHVEFAKVFRLENYVNHAGNNEDAQEYLQLSLRLVVADGTEERSFPKLGEVKTFEGEELKDNIGESNYRVLEVPEEENEAIATFLFPVDNGKNISGFYFDVWSFTNNEESYESDSFTVDLNQQF